MFASSTGFFPSLRKPVPGFQIVKRGVHMVGSELNRPFQDGFFNFSHGHKDNPSTPLERAP